MAKKGSFLKTIIGVGSLAVAGKVVYDKYKGTKEEYVREENESKEAAVKKYNAIAESKVIELQDEEFEGCDIKASASKVVLDLSLAVIVKDVYINFKSQASNVMIVLPDSVNAVCDVENTVSRVKNEVENVNDKDIPTVYIIGIARMSSIYVIPADFYGEDDDFEDDGTYVSPVSEDADETEVSDKADEACGDETPKAESVNAAVQEPKQPESKQSDKPLKEEKTAEASRKETKTKKSQPKEEKEDTKADEVISLQEVDE